MRSGATAVAFMSACCLSNWANASTMLFDSVTDTGSILYSTTHDGAALSARVDFTLNSLSATGATFGVKVANNSSGPGTNRLMSFGIDVVSPALTGASTTGGVWDASTNDVLPSFQHVDLCIWRSNNCSGGAIGDGLSESSFDVFTMTLTTAGNFLQGVSFTSPYGIKFQDVGTTGNSFEFAGVPGDPPVRPQNSVPEPASIALLGIGLAGLGFSRRRTLA